MNDFVLDSSAVLTYLSNEPGAEFVAQSLLGALLCSVNLAEAASKLRERGMPLDKIATAMAAVGFEIVEFGEDLAMICGDLSVDTRDLGLSLGDRACLALARQRAAVALTADAVWERVPGVNVRLLRSAGA